MTASVKNPPVFKVRMYDLKAAPNRRFKGEMAMEVIIYLPGIPAPCMKPRLFQYCDDSGKSIAIMFKGAKINLDNKRLSQLCKRLALVRKCLVGYVRRLAQLAAAA